MTMKSTATCPCGFRLTLGPGDQECPKCGQWFNAFGQRLKPPEEWGPEDEDEGWDRDLDLTGFELEQQGIQRERDAADYTPEED
jgi:hypothetical protein